MMRVEAIAAALFVSAAPVFAGGVTPPSPTDGHTTMITEGKQADEVRAAIDELIQTATSYDVDVLDRIYNDSLHVVMIGIDHSVNVADKAAFKSLFAQKRDAGDPPMDTWVKYHRIEVTGGKAHVLLSRKNDLSGVNMDLILSIDLIHEDGRWQVTREVIFLRPEDVS